MNLKSHEAPAKNIHSGHEQLVSKLLAKGFRYHELSPVQGDDVETSSLKSPNGEHYLITTTAVKDGVVFHQIERVNESSKLTTDETCERKKRMKTFGEFIKELAEGKSDDLKDRLAIKKANADFGWEVDGDDKPSAKRIIKGLRYGGSRQNDEEETKGHEQGEEASKRGRGRPKGSKSGARTKGGDGGMSGTDDYTVHIPSKSVYF